ncbi:MAG TPA: Rieske (2Fe-2S) protein [Micromonosporaceae bacterium]|nr:Rieske (2Fe-2S) protein [Micromonosporaceae bacterium]
MTETTRRAVLAGAAGAGAAAVLAGCGDDEPDSGDAAAAAGALAKAADIPVGGGRVFAEQKVVVTQPTAGTYKGFTTTCTHQGCSVEKVEDGVIKCPCHGSMFSINDGSVKGGPATRPLPEKAIKLEGGDITVT